VVYTRKLYTIAADPSVGERVEALSWTRLGAPEPQRAILDCYTQIQGDSPVRGVVLMSFQVETSGAALEPQVIHDTLDAYELSACIGQTLEGLRFPPQPETVTVAYAFEFDAE